jgi:hypothetical protein
MLPPGLTMSAAGVISGTPTSTGTYTFRLTATDAVGNTFMRVLTLTVNNASGLRVTNVNPPDAWVGRGRATLTLATSGPSTYTWSLLNGTLPPGVGVVSTDGITTRLVGAPLVPGVFVFTLRATDNGNPANFADHTFTYRVGPTQVISPPVEFVTLADLPSGNVGVPYSFAIRVAGGTPPYTFTSSPFSPLPPGLSLGPSGVLSGTPTATGNYFVQPIITDATGATVNALGMTLIVAANGEPPPLVRAGVTNLLDGSVGLPVLDHLIDLNVTIRGGVRPYTFAVTPGSSLPPGMVLFPGTNGLAPRLGGVPTTPGLFNFSLDVTDSSGQTLTIPFTKRISSIAVRPPSVPPGAVGQAYSQQLTFSGGVAPYTILVAQGSDTAPGVSIDAAGLIAGTPTAPGNFRLQFAISDSSGDSVTVFYYLTVDNAAGQSPALSVTPDPIEINAAPATPPAPVGINIASTSGSLPFAAMVSGIPGATLSSDAGTTPSTLTLNVPALPAGTYSGVVAVQSTAAANAFDAVAVLVTSSSASCSFSATVPSATIPAFGGSGSFEVLTGPACAWRVVGPPQSVVRMSTRTGTGNGTVSYIILSNTSASARVFELKINGQTVHTITQVP